MTMLDAVYVDSVDEKAIVAIQPKPAFLPLFEVATTREGSDVFLFSERETPSADGPEAHDPCLWWRRGRVERYLQHCLAVLLIAGYAASRDPVRGNITVQTVGAPYVPGRRRRPRSPGPHPPYYGARPGTAFKMATLCTATPWG